MTARPHLKITEPRPLEDRTYQGGGGGTFHRDNYRQHANAVFEEAQSLLQSFQNEVKDSSISKRYVRVEVPEDKNLWQSDGKKISENIFGTLVGTPKKNVGHFSIPADSFNGLLEQLRGYSDSLRGKSKFAEIESIKKIPAAEKISTALGNLITEETYAGEALFSLFPDLTREEKDSVVQAVTEYLVENGGELLKRTDSEIGTVLRIRSEAALLENVAEYFLSIQTVDPIEEVITESAVSGDRIEDQVIVHPNTSSAKVCIFDTGVISDSRFIDSSIIARETPLGTSYLQDQDHGTFVASRIIYGNTLRDAISMGHLRPDVKVLSVSMMTRDSIGNSKKANSEEFLKIIRETVQRWHQQIRVYNISLNLVLSDSAKASIVTDDHVGPVAAEIDKLSKEFKVLFVLTTGNIPIAPNVPPPNAPYPEYFSSENSRICRPGEAMLALTVGSFSDRANLGSMARISYPAPFTRRGPGFNNYRKPDLVAAGGNFASNWQTFNDLSVAGIGKDGDRIAYGNGTSYSAPLISRLAAHLFDKIPGATPDLVRALLIHSAVWPIDNQSEENSVFQNLIGNGCPQDSFLLNSDKWKQHYFYSGTAGYRKITKIPFYVPSTLTSRTGNDKVKIKFSLAFSPDTNRTLKTGYCKSHLRTKIFKLDSHQNLVATSVDQESTDVISDRYSTIIRYEKTFSREVEAGDWQLLVEQQSKWDVEGEVPFSVVISVEDPRRDNNVDIFAAIGVETNNRYQNLINIGQRVQI